jgi:activator of 2-hydroxyglutaryl-CoA dehydratase
VVQAEPEVISAPGAGTVGEDIAAGLVESIARRVAAMQRGPAWDMITWRWSAGWQTTRIVAALERELG